MLTSPASDSVRSSDSFESPTTPSRVLWVAVVNYNGWKDTLECLSSLSRSVYENFTPLVIDNASSDESLEKIRRAFPDVRIVRSDVNLGYAGACNLAARMALAGSARYCLVLNNDLVLEANALRFLVAAAIAHPRAAAVGPAVLDYYHRDRVLSLGARVNLRTGWSEHTGRGKTFSTIFKEPVEIQGYIDGCALLFMLDKIETIGWMDESLFMYFEDTDWCYRAQNAGFPLVVEPNAVVWHKVGRSSSKQTVKINYWFHRNRVFFEKKYASRFEWYCFCLGALWNTIPARQLYKRWQHGDRGIEVQSRLKVGASIASGFLDGLVGGTALQKNHIIE